jgi:oxygen-independent coproporphyrinogen-3 oxidase
MEANPGTTEPDKLHAMKEGGINRVSFGVQSFDNRLLKEIGRIHDTDDVYRSIENARKAGIANLSIDLMFGLPRQTLSVLEQSLDAALALQLPHYSIYSLKVEENTLFHTLYRKDRLPLPSEDEEAEMFSLIMRRLREAGYRQYEISNFALPGFESRHNSAYWLNHSYYGLGAGAHGYVRGRRHVNVKGVREYIEAAQKGLPRLESFEVSRREAMEDFMMVGLRLLEGVNREYFRTQFGEPFDDVFAEPLFRLLQSGLIEKTEQGYRLTEQGIFWGNEVFGAFLD